MADASYYYEGARALIENEIEEVERDFEGYILSTGNDPDKFELPEGGIDFTEQDVMELAQIISEDVVPEETEDGFIIDDIPLTVVDWLVDFIFSKLKRKE